MNFTVREWIVMGVCIVGLAFLAGVWVGRATTPQVKVTVFKR